MQTGSALQFEKTSPLLPTRSEYQVRTVSFVREGDQKKKVRGGKSLSSANGSRWLVCHNKRGSKQEMPEALFHHIFIQCVY